MNKLATKLQANPLFCLVVVFVLFCIVGTMDYNDATRGKPAAESTQ